MRRPWSVGPRLALVFTPLFARSFLVISLLASSFGCQTGPLVPPEPDVTAVEGKTIRLPMDRKLDLLFMVDNSLSMSPLQATMAANFRAFMEVLKDPKTHELPDLHLGVVSSDMGAGRAALGPITQCSRIGGDGGAFHAQGVNPPGCRGPDGPFIISSYRPNGERLTNVGDAEVSDAFSCIALLGEKGCGFESQFGSTLAALERNEGGFLRDDAYLAVVMLTNEDDCTVPPDSNLFDPGDMTPADPKGALWNYRCTEFGISCDQPLPHQAPDTPVTLTNCHSKEDGVLLKVADFVTRLKQVKADSSRIFFGAISTPTGDASGKVLPLSVRSASITASGGTVKIPDLAHTCEAQKADPAVRIFQAVSAFGKNGLFAPQICEQDYTAPLAEIAKGIIVNIEPACTKQKIAHNADGTPHCAVQDAKPGSAPVNLPHCQGGDAPGPLPCWHEEIAAGCDGLQLEVQRDPSVHGTVTTHASCEVCLPGVTTPGCD